MLAMGVSGHALIRKFKNNAIWCIFVYVLIRLCPINDIYQNYHFDIKK